ncbi:MAG: [protein-PII] uridylyltransferase [Gammaproteobacteria bacterium]|nr:[protein-PII] uridylyltransferase [Gammaproteobacteria bacterium]
MWHEEISDPVLFDQAAFEQALRNGTAALPLCKRTLSDGRHRLLDQFASGKPIRELVHKRAWLIDHVLTEVWRLNVDVPDLALVAVGGYGRGELHPCSDIDLLILTKSRLSSGCKSQIERFLTFLWDTGLEVGHSVRSVRQCVREAKSDVTVATNLIEARLLCGNRDLFDELVRETSPRRMWPTRRFFEAKLREQAARHQKFEHTEHSLEPNVKEGPGGLRDIQMIGWVAQRHFGPGRLRDLVARGFLTEQEYQALGRGRSFLWQVRFALHKLTGRREDRLQFDHQKSVAALFGYEAPDNSGVEQFMKLYYRTVRELNRLNEMLLQHFEEVIIYARRTARIRPINKRFQAHNDFIEARSRNVFSRYPLALLELFLLIQQDPRIKGVRASTIRLVRESLPLIDDDFRADIRNRSLFMEIIRQPRHVGHELRRMHRYGVLGAYLPEFASIEGQMQFDLFHVYTVDEHILFVVRNMRYFGLKEESRQFPLLCQRVLKAIPKQELLYLAGIFHDIAKGRRGDHSDLGAEDAVRFCIAHQLSEFDARLVGWLVKHHLLMSKTAQREDIDDPDVVNHFAAAVGDVMHLNYLYLLTVADISGTNPKLWNSWKGALLGDLYDRTLLALRRGLENPIDKEERIRDVKAETLAILRREPPPGGFDPEEVWSGLGDDYFLRHSPDEIAWHTCAIARVSDDRLPLILVREMTDRGGTEIFIYMRDHDNIFSRSTRALDRLGLNIVDARIITSNSGYTLDTFIVLEESGEVVKGKDRIREIKEGLRDALISLDQPLARITRIRPRTLKHFPIPTHVRFSTDDKNRRTVMEVIATDRPGFLSSVGVAMEFCGARLHGAKIATYGERVEDIFFITDRSNRIITDPPMLNCLRSSITDSLTAN